MADLPQTRHSLLLRLRDRSNDAWVEFLEIYEQAIVDYARRRGLQEADARDVSQEVLAAVSKKVEQWQADPAKGKFRGWLFRVARNIAVDKVVQLARRSGASGDTQVAQLLAQQPAVDDSESTAFWMEYRRGLLTWAAHQVRPLVKETSWTSFVRTAVDGEKPEVVAMEMGISVGSVYAAKFRIVNKIRKAIAKLDDSEALENELFQGNDPFLIRSDNEAN